MVLLDIIVDVTRNLVATTTYLVSIEKKSSTVRQILLDFINYDNYIFSYQHGISN